MRGTQEPPSVNIQLNPKTNSTRKGARLAQWLYFYTENIQTSEGLSTRSRSRFEPESHQLTLNNYTCCSENKEVLLEVPTLPLWLKSEWRSKLGMLGPVTSSWRALCWLSYKLSSCLGLCSKNVIIYSELRSAEKLLLEYIRATTGHTNQSMNACLSKSTQRKQQKGTQSVESRLAKRLDVHFISYTSSEPQPRASMTICTLPNVYVVQLILSLAEFPCQEASCNGH